MATTPSSAARRPRPPPTSAIAAAMPSHRRELLAASESRRTGRSSSGVGVRATASYTARSTAASSRNASAQRGVPPGRASTRRAKASAMVSFWLSTGCVMPGSYGQLGGHWCSS